MTMRSVSRKVPAPDYTKKPLCTTLGGHETDRWIWAKSAEIPVRRSYYLELS